MIHTNGRLAFFYYSVNVSNRSSTSLSTNDTNSSRNDNTNIFRTILA